jgi:hypothetical protein
MTGKVSYKSEGVIIASGENAHAIAAEAAGHTVEHTTRMIEFSDEIIQQAKLQGLTTEQCYTAALNAMVRIILLLPSPEGRNQIVSATTEALCAAIGGGSDQGRQG